MQGTTGVAPWHDSTLNEDYAAAGVALTLAGNLHREGFTPRGKKRRQAARQAKWQARWCATMENNIARDVRIAWLNANNSREQMSLSTELRQQADENVKLAQARYDTGSSSIVELSEAQLGLTSAQIQRDRRANTMNISYRRAILEYQIGGNDYTEASEDRSQMRPGKKFAPQGDLEKKAKRLPFQKGLCYVFVTFPLMTYHPFSQSIPSALSDFPVTPSHDRVPHAFDSGGR